MTDKPADPFTYPSHAMQAERALPDFLWGAEKIGRAIGLNARQTHHLLINGDIKCARKVRDRWCAHRETLMREFGAVT